MFESWEAGWGLDVVMALQATGNPFFDAVAVLFAALGSNLVYLAVLPLIFWCIDRHLGRWLFVVLVTGLVVVIGSKELFGRPRPYVFSPDLIVPLFSVDGNGFPSGHVGISMALWGFVALWARRVWGYVLLAVYIAVMGWARMYAGVHYPQDVIGGLLVGGAVAGGVYFGQVALLGLWARVPVAVRAVLVIVAGVLMAWLLRGDPYGVAGAGILIGGGLGLIATRAGDQFRAEGTLSQRGLRYVAGIALTMVIFLALDFAFAPLQPEVVFRVIRYTLVTALILGVYPLVLVQTGFTQSPASLGETA